MKRKHHARSTSKGPRRSVAPEAQTGDSSSGRAYPRAVDAGEVVARAGRDLARLLRTAARPLVGATAASLLFGAMMGGCMPTVRPGEMPEQTPARKMLDEQQSEDAPDATEAGPAQSAPAAASS